MLMEKALQPLVQHANATGATSDRCRSRLRRLLRKVHQLLGIAHQPHAWGATALGVGASARADNSIAVGSAAVTEGRESTALGRRSSAGAQSATALGTGSKRKCNRFDCCR